MGRTWKKEFYSIYLHRFVRHKIEILYYIIL